MEIKIDFESEDFRDIEFTEELLNQIIHDGGCVYWRGMDYYFDMNDAAFKKWNIPYRKDRNNDFDDYPDEDLQDNSLWYDTTKIIELMAYDILELRKKLSKLKSDLLDDVQQLYDTIKEY